MHPDPLLHLSEDYSLSLAEEWAPQLMQNSENLWAFCLNKFQRWYLYYKVSETKPFNQRYRPIFLYNFQAKLTAYSIFVLTPLSDSFPPPSEVIGRTACTVIKDFCEFCLHTVAQENLELNTFSMRMFI